MRLRFSPRSRDDLKEIGDYVSRRSPRAAQALVRTLTDKYADLVHQPLRFAVLPHRPELEIRRRVVGCYLIFYTVKDDLVEVVRVLHGARDAESILFPDDES